MLLELNVKAKRERVEYSDTAGKWDALELKAALKWHEQYMKWQQQKDFAKLKADLIAADIP